MADKKSSLVGSLQLRLRSLDDEFEVFNTVWGPRSGEVFIVSDDECFWIVCGVSEELGNSVASLLRDLEKFRGEKKQVRREQAKKYQ